MNIWVKILSGFLAILIIAAAGWVIWSNKLWTNINGTSNVPITKRQPLTILTVGDINLGRKTGQEIFSGNLDFPFVNIKEFLQDADITFGNLESQLRKTSIFQDPQNEYRFCGPLEGAQALKDAGFDILSVANNHMWDYGQKGLNSTLAALKSQELYPVGASEIPGKQYEPVVLEKNGWKIVFFALTDFINGYERAGAADYIAHTSNLNPLLNEIGKIKNNSDLVIVSFHNGSEYSLKPIQRSIKTAHKLIDAGADIVIGHHPHVVQPIEEYVSSSASSENQDNMFSQGTEGMPKPKGLIFYSLGNFAFWQPFTFWTQHGLAAKLTLSESHQVSYKLIPIKAGWQPALLRDEKVKNTLLNQVLPS